MDMKNKNQQDCFLAVIIYMFKKLNLNDAITAALALTYNFYFIPTWKSLDDNIIYSYKEEEIKNRLPELGLSCLLEEKGNVFSKAKKKSDDKITVIEIDAYLCPWHPAYLSYNVKHHMILINIDDNEMEILDPFFSSQSKTIDFHEAEQMPMKFWTYWKNERDTIDFVDFTISHIVSNKNNIIHNTTLFYNNFHDIYDKLIIGIDNFNSVQLFRDIKSIVNSKNNFIFVMQKIGAMDEIIEISKMLKNKWSILMSRLVHLSITKKGDRVIISNLVTDIVDKEKTLACML